MKNWGFIKHKFLLFPVLLGGLYFAMDKACLNNEFKMLSQPDAVYLFFDYKETLLDQLVEAYEKNQAVTDPAKKKKFFMVLGSSRMMYFSYPQFSRNFPRWEIFNFSAPVTSPAYYTYLLDRALERGVKPDYILVETDPYQFNKNSNVFVRSNLAHGFDLQFILEHASLFSNDEISYFLARWLFAGFKYPPKPQNLLERTKKKENIKLAWLKELDDYQKKNRGAAKSLIPRPDWYERDFPRLEGVAAKDLRRLYSNYQLSERMFDFLKVLVEQARDNDVAVVFLRPPVSRPFERMALEDDPLAKEPDHRRRAIGNWEARMDEFLKPYGFPYVDLARRKDYYCNTFVDATHMSLDCFHPMLILAMREYEEFRRKQGSGDLGNKRGVAK